MSDFILAPCNAVRRPRHRTPLRHGAELTTHWLGSGGVAIFAQPQRAVRLTPLLRQVYPHGMKKADRRIQRRLEEFADQLIELIRQTVLEELSEAVGGGSRSSARKAPSTGRRGRGRVAPARASVSRAKAKSGKRSSEELERLTTELGGYVKKNPGQRIEQIAKAMGVATKDLKLPVIKLVDAGTIKTKGQKRATQYLPR